MVNAAFLHQFKLAKRRRDNRKKAMAKGGRPATVRDASRRHSIWAAKFSALVAACVAQFPFLGQGVGPAPIVTTNAHQTHLASAAVVAGLTKEKTRCSRCPRIRHGGEDWILKKRPFSSGAELVCPACWGILQRPGAAVHIHEEYPAEEETFVAVMREEYGVEVDGTTAHEHVLGAVHNDEWLSAAIYDYFMSPRD